MAIPNYYGLCNPTLEALRTLGGSGSTNEITEKVISQLNLTEEETKKVHGEGPRTVLEYRLAWARTLLKRYGHIDNSSHGIWALTQQGLQQDLVDQDEVKKHYREYIQQRQNTDEETELVDTEEDTSWQQDLLGILKSIPPNAFERLCQRLLRESGFIEVEVTGRSGDGGIDGHGIIRLAGLVSFPVLFQCKRYSGSVSPKQVRDFRGAMTGRADKGLIITTGGFTSNARQEATREGAPPIDLLDGIQLVEKLKELELGVSVKTVEKVEINKQWFENF